jgi:hypothetical protein
MKWATRLRLRMLAPEIIRRVYRHSGIAYEGDSFRQEGSVRVYFLFAVARAARGSRRR